MIHLEVTAAESSFPRIRLSFDVIDIHLSQSFLNSSCAVANPTHCHLREETEHNCLSRASQGRVSLRMKGKKAVIY